MRLSKASIELLQNAQKGGMNYAAIVVHDLSDSEVLLLAKSDLIAWCGSNSTPHTTIMNVKDILLQCG